MNSSFFFFLFIPFLAAVLLAVNLLFAPHNPYQEKNSVFECGFHSFLGQNRTQFSISFFIFALLFLLFDLEILLVYPYVVSGYSNDIYGLITMLIFFSVLTLGFAFELGKKALNIDSRQFKEIVKPSSKISGFVPKFLSTFYRRGRRRGRVYISKFYELLTYYYAILRYKNLFISSYVSKILLWLFIIRIGIFILSLYFNYLPDFISENIIYYFENITQKKFDNGETNDTEGNHNGKGSSSGSAQVSLSQEEVAQLKSLRQAYLNQIIYKQEPHPSYDARPVDYVSFIMESVLQFCYRFPFWLVYLCIYG